jgi:hypothetical protein
VTTPRKFNRDYAYVRRLAKRMAEELLLEPVRARLRRIQKSNLNTYPGLAAKAAELLNRKVEPPAEIGRKALVSVRTNRGGVIQVCCIVVRKIPQRVNRFGMMYEVTPVGGQGRIKVNESKVKILD